MSVANILPGDTIKVELRYTELLVPEGGEYEFAFPTVVGPRYSNEAEATAPQSNRWIANPYLQKGEVSPSTFQISVDLVAGMPLQDVRCATHEVAAQFRDASHAVITLRGGDAQPNNRDFILKYRLADSRIQSGLLLAKGEKENFFLLTVQPPMRTAAMVLPPRDYVFVLDVSGSMRGFPIETAKSLLRELFKDLKPADTFNVLLFSGASRLLSPTQLPATSANLESAFQLIDHERGGGGTELLPALQQALALPNETNAARSIVVVTDGYVSCETEAFDLIRGNLSRASLFAFGIGSSVNRFLLEGMARAGQGEPFIVTTPEGAKAEVRKFRDYISAPLLTHVTIDFGGFDVYDVEPTSIPDTLADRPTIVFGKWKGDAYGVITLRGRTGAGEYVQQFTPATTRPLEGSNALTYLWARSRIATLSDYNQLSPSDERRREVTSLGLTYNLLTAHTSFVAVDDAIRNPGGTTENVKQALPLPLGVENSAVGGDTHAVPEPETSTFMLLAIAAGILGYLRRRCDKRPGIAKVP